MSFYYSLDKNNEDEQRIAQRLLDLKKGFKAHNIPQRSIQDTLLLATWNIREFDSPRFGTRGKEPLYYIAEIISCFDLIAVQEVRDDIRGLVKLMDILGVWWKYIITDVTIGIRGNLERMAFIFDSRKVVFGNLVGEVVIPPIEINKKTVAASKQLARTPFMVGFKAGWFKFTICTTHILYGKNKADDPERIEEIKALSDFLANRTKDRHAWSNNMILLGDFNIFDPSDATLNAIESAGFLIPDKLKKLPTNIPQTKHYDQIAFIAPDIKDHLELSEAGVFNFFNHVYQVDDEEIYSSKMGKNYLRKNNGVDRNAKEKTNYYKNWRTYQMSDHLPMWIELKIDFGEEYLQRIIEE